MFDPPVYISVVSWRIETIILDNSDQRQSVDVTHNVCPVYFADKRNSNDVGPTLGLKKSSSLESLQTAVQDATLDDGQST